MHDGYFYNFSPAVRIQKKPRCSQEENGARKRFAARYLDGILNCFKYSFCSGEMRKLSTAF